MQPTLDEFVKKFQAHVIGLMVFGTAAEQKDSPLTRAGRILEMPEESRKLLTAMYRFLHKTAPEPVPSANGTHKEKAGA